MRSNLVWDSKSRRAYAWSLIAITIAWPVAIAVFGLTVSASFTDIVLILLPSVSLIIQNIQTIGVHFEIADAKDTVRKSAS